MVPSPETEPAPLPHLQSLGASVAPGGESHPWHIGIDTTPIIGIRYQSSTSDYWRINLYILRKQAINILVSIPGTIIMIAIIDFFVSMTMFSALNNHNGGGSHRFNTYYQYWTFVHKKMWRSAWITPFWLSCMFAPTAYKMIRNSRRFAESAKDGTTLSLTRSGIYEATTDRSVAISWGQVADVQEHDGDVIFVPTVTAKAAKIDMIFVPRSAFADAPAARQFAGAVRTLWKNGGDPDAVPTELPRRNV